VLAGAAAEELTEAFGFFLHREVAPRDLDRLDAQQLARHEPLPGRLEELIVSRVHEHSRDVGMFIERVLADRRRQGPQVLSQHPRSLRW